MNLISTASKTKKPRPQNLRTGHPARLLHGGNRALTSARLVAAGAAGLGRAGLVLRDHRGGVLRDANREDVVGCFDLAKELLVANLLESDRWFEFASWAHFTGKHQHARVIFIAEDLKFRGVEIVCAVDCVPARGKCCSCHNKVVGDIHYDLIDGLGAGSDGQRSQAKNRRQKSDVTCFHNFSFCVVRSVGWGSRASFGHGSAKASTSNRSNNHAQNVYARLDGPGGEALSDDA